MVVRVINWLPLSDRKNMPSVRIEIEENYGQLYGGYYCPNTATIVAVHYAHDPLEKELATSLAHEYRHHIQHVIKNVPTVVLRVPTNIANNYEPSIRWYFRNSISELDALFYQNKYAKCDMSDWWLRKLVLPAKLT